MHCIALNGGWCFSFGDVKLANKENIKYITFSMYTGLNYDRI